MELPYREPAVYRATTQSVKILLIEDDPDQAVLTRINIGEGTDSFFHLEWKDDLKTAMDRLQLPGIDVVLLDLGMTETNGYRTHLAIRRVSAAPVVILTSDESADSQDLTKNLGAACYLIKHRVSPLDIRRALWDAVSAP
jgi:DNA-binding response OmpR family regulator